MQGTRFPPESSDVRLLVQELDRWGIRVWSSGPGAGQIWNVPDLKVKGVAKRLAP